MYGRERPVTSTFCEKRKLPEGLRGSSRLCLLGFPEGDGGSGGVAENTHLTVAGNLAGIDDDLGAEGFGLGGGGFDVVDADVGQPLLVMPRCCVGLGC